MSKGNIAIYTPTIAKNPMGGLVSASPSYQKLYTIRCVHKSIDDIELSRKGQSFTADNANKSLVNYTQTADFYFSSAEQTITPPYTFKPDDYVAYASPEDLTSVYWYRIEAIYQYPMPSGCSRYKLTAVKLEPRDPVPKAYYKSGEFTDA